MLLRFVTLVRQILLRLRDAEVSSFYVSRLGRKGSILWKCRFIISICLPLAEWLVGQGSSKLALRRLRYVMLDWSLRACFPGWWGTMLACLSLEH